MTSQVMPRRPPGSVCRRRTRLIGWPPRVLGGVGDQLGGQQLGVAGRVVHAPRGQRAADGGAGLPGGDWVGSQVGAEHAAGLLGLCRAAEAVEGHGWPPPLTGSGLPFAAGGWCWQPLRVSADIRSASAGSTRVAYSACPLSRETVRRDWR